MRGSVLKDLASWKAVRTVVSVIFPFPQNFAWDTTRTFLEGSTRSQPAPTSRSTGGSSQGFTGRRAGTPWCSPVSQYRSVTVTPATGIGIRAAAVHRSRRSWAARPAAGLNSSARSTCSRQACQQIVRRCAGGHHPDHAKLLGMRRRTPIWDAHTRTGTWPPPQVCEGSSYRDRSELEKPQRGQWKS